MRIFMLTLLFFLCSCSSFNRSISSEKKADGHVVANGGDVVFCSKSKGTGFSGIYVLDEVLSDKKNRVKQSNEEYLLRLVSTLKKIGPIGDDFFEFYKLFSGREFDNDFKSHIKWTQNDGKLIKINDEHISKEDYRTMPDNCNNIVQAVIRKKYDNGNLEFVYHKKTVDELFTSNKIDWLLVHEFLWKYLDDANYIRKVNEFFHSSNFFTMTPTELTLQLNEKFKMSVVSYSDNDKINDFLQRPFVCKGINSLFSSNLLLVYQPIYLARRWDGSEKFNYSRENFSWQAFITMYSLPIYERKKILKDSFDYNISDVMPFTSTTKVISARSMQFTPQIISDSGLFPDFRIIENKAKFSYSLDLGNLKNVNLVYIIPDKEHNRNLTEEIPMNCQIREF